MISDLNKQQVCSHEIETKDRKAYTILWFRGEENLYSFFWVLTTCYNVVGGNQVPEEYTTAVFLYNLKIDSIFGRNTGNDLPDGIMETIFFRLSSLSIESKF